LDDVPLYVVVKEVLNKEAHVEAVEINYLTFYAFNGPYTIGVPPFAFQAGAHDGDWEHFTVRCILQLVHLKHLLNVETRFYCPQAFLSCLDFHCRMTFLK